MANRDTPIGFRTFGPVKSYRPYDIESATACYINDVMMYGTLDSADGYVDPATAGVLNLLGASQNYHAANAGITTVIIADDPSQLFLAQDNAGATLTIANQGDMGDFVAGSGSSTTLLSGHEINGATLGTTETGFIVVDLDDRPDNAWGTWCDLIVKAYEHCYWGVGTAS